MREQKEGREGEEEGGRQRSGDDRRGGVFVLMLCMAGRSRMTMRPSHDYNARTEHVGFPLTRHCLHQARSVA